MPLTVLGCYIPFPRLKNSVLLNCSSYKRHHIFLIISQSTICLPNRDYEMDSPADAERYLHKQFDLDFSLLP